MDNPAHLWFGMITKVWLSMRIRRELWYGPLLFASVNRISLEKDNLVLNRNIMLENTN